MNQPIEVRKHSSDDKSSSQTNLKETTARKNCSVENNALESRDLDKRQFRKKREYSFVLHDQTRFKVMYDNKM